jgi:glycosyltransferase involved in cell wall biosynthesis
MSADPKPSVSVIIPACRRPQFLKEALESVLAQTFTDFELIVVDDDPGCSARMVAGAFKDARVLYCSHAVNRGGSAARNTGLMQARGRYVAFLDDDDLWRPSFLEKMLQLFSTASSRVGVVYCPVEFMDADGTRTLSRISGRSRGDVHEDILKGERSIVSTIALIRREVFDVRRF